MDQTDRRYCPFCGHALARKAAGGQFRLVCLSCGKISYENPTTGVAGILFHPDGKGILLGRRKTGEIRGGQWCIPCGHVEYNEDIRQAIVREMREETGFLICPVRIYNVYSNFHEPGAHTTGLWFLTRAEGGLCQAGDDLSEVNFFLYDELPELAFPTDAMILEQLHRERFF
ncbi:MAG TPA: ADP-ribose pyrophosphatase [Veillonellaceae bacterium]|jgi:ADP-ribose pyrophosphatase YjhB (NUDIX family)|nr:ADP-ribose pyrophosphatase [Veillonellaceae bacterium]